MVATPIGNLADITLRALHVLQLADTLACEDTRHSKTLLNQYGIQKPLIAAHEHNENEAAQHIIERLQRGERIALITDAGTLVRTRVSEVSIVGRNTQGVILIRTAEDENVVGLQRVAEPVDDEELDAIDGSAAEGDEDIAPEADTDDDIAEDEA